jgi:hypothetical protein
VRSESIKRALDSMDIPALRRDITKPENIRWLLRNLPINNANHIDLGQVMSQLQRDLNNFKNKED